MWVRVPVFSGDQRIEVDSERDGQALLTQIVTAGAAELFGTEFGAAH